MHRLPIPARVGLAPALAVILLCGGLAAGLRAEQPPLAERFLLGDGIGAGMAALDRHLAAHGDDAEALVVRLDGATCIGSRGTVTWWRLQRVFRGNFIGFAIWFN